VTPVTTFFRPPFKGGKIDVLLPENIVDFPQADLGPNAKALRPDQFFSELLKDFPVEFVTLIREMSANLKSPPMSVSEVLGRLQKNGIPEFAKQMRDLLT
jgi:hypothetical protein